MAGPIKYRKKALGLHKIFMETKRLSIVINYAYFSLTMDLTLATMISMATLL